MKVTAIVQARMGSTRLPGKVLMELAGETVLTRVIERLRRSTMINEILVATTDLPADDAIVTECRKCSVAISRGDQDDVLDRYFRAAQLTKAEVVVRITSDCPLIDPEITDQTVLAFLEGNADYASNSLVRTYPRGLDTEVMNVNTLARAWRQARKPYEREHVTPYMYEHPQEFKVLSVTSDRDFSHHRWTLDTAEDLEFVRAVYGHFEDSSFSWGDVLDLMDRHPELMELNRSVTQKTVQS